MTTPDKRPGHTASDRLKEEARAARMTAEDHLACRNLRGAWVLAYGIDGWTCQYSEY